MAELTDFRTALQAVLATGLNITFVPGVLTGPLSASSDMGSVYVRTVQEVPARVDEEQIIAVVRVFRQFDQQVTAEAPYDPTPLEGLLDQMQAIIAANQTGLGPWFARIVSFTIDPDTQGIEAQVLAYRANAGVTGG